MKWSSALISVAAGAAGGGIVWLAQTSSFSLAPAGVSYPDLIAVMLTGLSLLLAAVAVGLGILAFWGWTTFRGITEKAAGEAAIDHLKSGDGAVEIKQLVELKAIAVVQAGIRDGSIFAYAEQRNKEADEFEEVDKGWAEIDTGEN